MRRGIRTLIEELGNSSLLLNITTNGMLLKEFAHFLYENNVSVNVSLDTLVSEKFRKISGSYELSRIIEEIDIALGLGIKLKINTVLLRGVNDDEVFDFIDFASSRGVVIRFIEFMPFVSKYIWSKYFISEDEAKNIIKRKYDLYEAREGSSVAHYYVLENGAKIGFISTISKPFCHKCSRIRITSNGNLVLCMFDRFSYPLKKFLRPKMKERELIEFVSSVIKLKPKGFIEFKENQANFQMVKLGG